MDAPFPLARRYLSAGVVDVAIDIHTEGHKYPAWGRLPSMVKNKSWSRMRQIRHRDAVILSILSAACLLVGEVVDSVRSCSNPPCSLSAIYQDFIAPYLDNPPILVVLIGLTLLCFTTL